MRQAQIAVFLTYEVLDISDKGGLRRVRLGACLGVAKEEEKDQT